MVTDTVYETLTVTLYKCVHLQEDEAEGVTVEHLAVLSGRESILGGTETRLISQCVVSRFTVKDARSLSSWTALAALYDGSPHRDSRAATHTPQAHL